MVSASAPVQMALRAKFSNVILKAIHRLRSKSCPLSPGEGALCGCCRLCRPLGSRALVAGCGLSHPVLSVTARPMRRSALENVRQSPGPHRPPLEVRRLPLEGFLLPGSLEGSSWLARKTLSQFFDPRLTRICGMGFPPSHASSLTQGVHIPLAEHVPFGRNDDSSYPKRILANLFSRG